MSAHEHTSQRNEIQYLLEHSQMFYHIRPVGQDIIMSKRAVEAVFQGLYLLCDIRGVLRETVPHHHFSQEQQEKTGKTLDKLEKQIAILREELLK
jgi:hypothetical protein